MAMLMKRRRKTTTPQASVRDNPQAFTYDAPEVPTRVVFCRIGWGTDYSGPEKLRYGGSYVEEHETGNEVLNFRPYQILTPDPISGTEKTQDMFLGSYETKSTNGKITNQTHIEKIRGLGALGRNDNQAEQITVIWFARSPDQSGSYIVGWYRDATVYRYYQDMYDENDDFVRGYNISCLCRDAVLLAPEERLREEWRIPRFRTVNGQKKYFGPGQANVWYAREPEADQFIRTILEQIERYPREIMRD